MIFKDDQDRYDILVHKASHGRLNRKEKIELKELGRLSIIAKKIKHYRYEWTKPSSSRNIRGYVQKLS